VTLGRTKRLNTAIDAKAHARVQSVFSTYGLKTSEGLRIGLNVFAAALPVLARGGELVFRDTDGQERAYMFPFLDTNTPQVNLDRIRPREYYSCFISYNHGDRDFAQRLYEKLRLDGIDCWLDSHRMRPGDDMYDKVKEAIVEGDKVLLCCSKISLSSWWVDTELDIAFEKERRLLKQTGRKESVVIPLDLDGYLLLDEWTSGKAEQIRKRFAADFTDWKDSDERFEHEYNRLLETLRIDQE